MATYELGINTATMIDLYPNHGTYEKSEQKIESGYRSLSGRHYKYKWSTWDRIEFEAEYVSGANAAICNSWWDTNTNLLFLITSSTATEVNSVRIMGDESPFKALNQPYDDQYKGKIVLETY